MMEYSKIEALEALEQNLESNLEDLVIAKAKAEDKGIYAEVRLFDQLISEARARWSTAHRIVEFLKDERTEL